MAASLAEINALDAAAFTARLGGIYEHSPWIAQRAWPQRPFASVQGLHAAIAALLAGLFWRQHRDRTRYGLLCLK